MLWNITDFRKKSMVLYSHSCHQKIALFGMLIKIIHPLTLSGLKIILPTKKQSCNNLLLGSHQLPKPLWLSIIISGSLQGSERPQISDIAHELWCPSQHLCKFFQQDKGLILGNIPCFGLFVLWPQGPPAEESHGQTCSTRQRGGVTDVSEG